MAEVGESLEVNASRAEDVECFCINPYIYADLDPYIYPNLDDEDYRSFVFSVFRVNSRLVSIHFPLNPL